MSGAILRQVVAAGFAKNAGIITRAASYGGHGHHKQSTMNDLPIPQGDWHEDYAKRNTKYNAILISGLVTFLGTLAFLKTSDIVYFNYYPPTSID